MASGAFPPYSFFCLFCFLPCSQRFIQSPVFYQSVLTRPFLYCTCTCTTAITCPPQNEVICSVSSRILYGFSQEWTFLLSHDQAVRFQLPRCLMSCKYGSPPPQLRTSNLVQPVDPIPSPSHAQSPEIPTPA